VVTHEWVWQNAEMAEANLRQETSPIQNGTTKSGDLAVMCINSQGVAPKETSPVAAID
jgi:hypothetical protein